MFIVRLKAIEISTTFLPVSSRNRHCRASLYQHHQRYTAQRLLDKFLWDVLPSFVDPLADLIQFHGRLQYIGVLAGQHPLLPVLPHTIFKRFVDTCLPTPGITADSVFTDFSVLQIGFDKWAWKGSHTKVDFFLVTPPTFLQTVFSQSCTSPWSTKPFS